MNKLELTSEETLHKHWKAWLEKSPESKEMDLDIGTFLENNEDLKWILPAMEEYRGSKALPPALDKNGERLNIGNVVKGYLKDKHFLETIVVGVLEWRGSGYAVNCESKIIPFYELENVIFLL